MVFLAISAIFIKGGGALFHLVRLRGLAATIVLAAVTPAWGQRVQFPSMIAPPSGTAAPMATFDGTIQPAQPTWDPYSDPSAAAFSGQQPYYAPPSPSQYYNPTPPPAYGQPGSPVMFPQGYPPGGTMFGRVTRLVQEVRAQDTWVFGDGTEDNLDINTLEISATLAFPFLYNQAPLLVTPGAAVHWFEGPNAPGIADLPPRTYDVWVDAAWHPQLTERLHAELGVRPGIYTDFQHTTEDSFRIMGRALGVVTFSPTTQFKLGVVYIDRNDIKLLPAGGILYTPNADTRLDIYFPRPKLARRLTTVGNTSVWGYLSGEYGGGSWTTERAIGNDSFDYNDIRVMLGVETLPETLSGIKASFEVGYVFDREVEYLSGLPPRFDPSNTFMLRAGVAF